MPSLLPDLLDRRGEGLDDLDGAAVAEAARADDPLALEVLAGAGRALGIGIASLAHAFNPELVVLGGGVAAAGDLLFDPLREGLRSQLLPGYAPGDELPVVRSALGEDAGLLGAAVLALEGAR
jgi:glucokinase